MILHFPVHTHQEPVEGTENDSERSLSVLSEETLLSNREKTPNESESASSVLINMIRKKFIKLS